MKQIAKITLVGEIEEGVSKTSGQQWKARNVILQIAELDGFDSTLRMRVAGSKLEEFDAQGLQKDDMLELDIRLTNTNNRGFLNTEVWVKSYKKV